MKGTEKVNTGIGQMIALWMVVASLTGTGLALVFAPPAAGAHPSFPTPAPNVSGIARAGASAPLGVGAVIATITVGNGPEGIAFDSANGKLFVANTNANNLSVIDGSTNTMVGLVTLPSTPAISTQPHEVVFDSSNGYLYVSDMGMADVSVIDGATDANVTAVPMCNTCTSPGGMALDTGTGNLYVLSYDYFNYSVLSTASNSVTGTFFAGDYNSNTPRDACYDPSNGYLYVAQMNSTGLGAPSNILVINPATEQVVTTILTPDENGGCIYDSSNQDIYVTGQSATRVTVINGASNTVATTIPMGMTSPSQIAFDSQNGYLYVLNNVNLSVINGATNQVVGSLAVGSYPQYVAYDGTNHDIYVTNNLNAKNGTVTVVDPSSSGTGNPTISSFTVSPSSINLGQTAYYNVTASGGTPPYTYAYTGLPTGCATQSVNSLPCTPSAKGTYGTFVTVTDNVGKTATSNSAVLTVGSGGTTGTLTSVGITVAPSNATISPNGTATLTAVATCTGGSCPTGITYVWTLSGTTLGHLSSTTGQSVTFTAGSSRGSQSIGVTATLNGLSKTGQTTLNVGSGGGSTPAPSGNGWLLYGVIGVIAAVVVVAVVVVMLKKRPRTPTAVAPPPAQGYGAPPPPYAAPPQYGPPPPSQYGAPPPHP